MVKNNFKKLVSALLAACLFAVCCGMLVACHKVAPQADTKYYLYDSESESYNNNDYISINGDKCVVYTKDGKDGKALTLNGSVTYGGENIFDIECEYPIKRLSDLLSDKELKDMEEEMGVKNFEVTFDAKINFSCSGRKYKNALRVYAPTIVTSGFKGVFSMLNTTIRESGTQIYCQKGSKPDFSVKLTYDMNGGELDGKSVITLMSDSDGKIVLPDGKPEREDCEFLYYRVDKGYQVVNSSMRFDCDTTIKAQYKGLFKVTFDANSTEYEVSEDTKQFNIDEYSTCPIPKLVKKATAPKTRFKGWYIGDEQIFPGKTEIESHSVITAQWYSQKEVQDYMAGLSDKEADYLYVHVTYQNLDRTQSTFWGGTCIASRINADGSQGEYSDICDYGQIDIAGYEFKMDLNHHTMYQNGVSLKLFDCDILIRLWGFSGNHEFTVPKNKIKKGKPNHVFYNLDTKEVSYSW